MVRPVVVKCQKKIKSFVFNCCYSVCCYGFLWCQITYLHCQIMIMMYSTGSDWKPFAFCLFLKLYTVLHAANNIRTKYCWDALESKTDLQKNSSDFDAYCMYCIFTWPYSLCPFLFILNNIFSLVSVNQMKVHDTIMS